MREELRAKSKVGGKVLKRRKYLHIWLSYYCLLSNNSLYFYHNDSELVPDSILFLRGAILTKTSRNVDGTMRHQV